MIDNNLKEIMDLFGVDEDTAWKIARAGFRTGKEADEKAAEMFYEDSGLNGMFSKVKKDFDGLNSEKGFED